MSSAPADDPTGVPPRLVIVIAGPTAVGKSDAALFVAEAMSGQAELVSADSVQVYKKLDIGSNKPSAAEQQRCPTHLIDWLEPDAACTASMWTQEALRIIDDIHARGKTPIVVGGSSMYVDWLVHGEPDAGESDPEVQALIAEELRPFQEAMDWEGAVSVLADVAPEKPAKIMRNNWRMLARQLEVARTPSRRKGRASREGYDFRSFFLCPRDRHALFNRIDTRCLAMLRVGLFEETVGLLEAGALSRESSGGCAIGYRQVIEYLTRADPQEGDVKAFEDFLRTFGSATRSYARSQVQWFLKDGAFIWLPADPSNPHVVGRELANLASLPRADYEAASASDAVTREAWVAQGLPHASGPGSNFTSLLEQGGEVVADLAAVLSVADTCTGRVPARLRQTSEPPPLLLALASADGGPFGKVYWNGRHRTWGWGNPLGKLHKQALQLMESLGWRRVDEQDDSAVPAFCWPVRKAGDFALAAADGGTLPLIRPFPQTFTSRLDNKSQLAAHLVAAGHSDIHPPTWTAEEFLAAEPGAAAEEELWFVKHSLGVKGNGVYVYPNVEAVRRRVEELGPKQGRGFIVQRGVTPPALTSSGRKWMMRAHALLHRTADGRPRLYCHSDVIVVEHGQLYTPQTNVRAAHISSAGHPKHWPRPSLLQCDKAAAQVQTAIARAFAAVWPHLPQGPCVPAASELCQVFGVDLAPDAHGKIWLLEVNDYPTIASGTMEHVDTVVYTNLVRDVLRLVVLPCVDAAEPALGGFVELDVGSHVASSVSGVQAAGA